MRLAALLIVVAAMPVCLVGTLARAETTDEGVFLFAPDGDTFSTGSWTQSFITTMGAVPHIDAIQARVYAPFTFENTAGKPGISNFGLPNYPHPDTPLPTWSQTYDNGQYALAQGSGRDPNTGWLQVRFNLNFNGPNPTWDGKTWFAPGTYVYVDLQAYQLETVMVNGKQVQMEVRVANQSFRYGDVSASGYGKWYTLMNDNTWADPSTGYFDSTKIQGAWQASQVIPEPLTMLGVFAGVSGIGAYLRRRRVA